MSGEDGLLPVRVSVFMGKRGLTHYPFFVSHVSMWFKPSCRVRSPLSGIPENGDPKDCLCRPTGVFRPVHMQLWSRSRLIAVFDLMRLPFLILRVDFSGPMSLPGSLHRSSQTISRTHRHPFRPTSALLPPPTRQPYPSNSEMAVNARVILGKSNGASLWSSCQ